MHGLFEEAERDLAGCVAILVTQGLTLAAFVGIGSLARSALGARATTPRDVLMSAWLGWSLVIGLLLAWSLVAAVSSVPWLVTLAVGALGLAHGRRDLRACRPKPSRALVVALVAVAFWEANLSLGPDAAYDSGLYHIQAVQWAKAFPVVPGLANLHGPLGFNNSGLLLFAMLDAGPWSSRANHLGNGMGILLLAAQALTGLEAWRTANGRADRSIGAFDSMLLGPAMRMALHGGASSFVTDVAANAVALALGSSVFAFAIRRFATPADRRFGFVSCLLLAAAAASMRSNLGFYVAFVTLLLTAWEFRDSPRRTAWRTLAAGYAVAGFLGATWIARSIVLSGYPLFPTTLLPLPVDWRVPEIHARGEYAYAYYSERQFSWHYERWFSHMLSRPFAGWVPILVAVLLFAWGLARSSAARRERRPLALLGPVLGALLVWLMTVPSDRYALCLFWTLPALAMGWLALDAREQGESRGSRLAVVCVLALGLFPNLVRPALEGNGLPLEEVLRANLAAPGPDLFFQPTEVGVPATDFTTDSGLVLHTVPSHCWTTPLPCTPNPSPALRLRRAGDLGAGFSVDGKWRMRDWPYPWTTLAPFLREWRQRFPAPG